MALTIGAVQSTRGVPKSVAEITKDASDYEFNALVPLKYWLRTATALTKQAEIYMKEGDDEMTYFLLFRHAHLCLSHLSSHPEYKSNDPAMRTLKSDVAQNLKALELLKTRINRRHDEWLEVQKTKRSGGNQRQLEQSSLYAHDRAGSRRALSPDRTRQVSGIENADLAARIAGQEFSQRSSSLRAQPSHRQRGEEVEDLAARMRAIRTRIDPEGAQNHFGQREAPIQKSDSFNYPSVPLQKPQAVAPRLPQKLLPQSDLSARQYQSPVPPPKQRDAPDVQLPFRPLKPDKTTGLAPKAVEPTYTFAPGAELENGTPLRTIFLPPTMRTTFLRLAYKNTGKNLETCGFLAGTLRANGLFASTLIIPKQESTSDTCEMTDESELFDFVDQNELMILGWIHTHPTQTCFMSSRDLHTHSGYQMMLAESIAIVCAPSKGDTSHGGDWGVYRLTDPPGKMAILQCDKPGIFHPHDVDNVYTDAMRPGHVMEISGMDFEVVDLR